MLHFGLFEIKTDVFVLLLAIIFVLFQMFLCLNVKRTIIRLMPVYLSLGLFIIFTILSLIFDGWDSFGFFFLAICSSMLLVGSGIGWGVWVMVKKIRH